MKTIITLTALCATVSLPAQIQVTENPAPVGAVHEIDFDLLPPGPTNVAAVNSIATPSPSDISKILLAPNSRVPTGIYSAGLGGGRALGLLNGGLELIDPPSGGYDAFQAQILLGGPTTEFGVGIGDYINKMELEFFRSGFSLGTITTSEYTTPGIKYFEARFDSFDEVHVRTATGGGNFVITGLAIGPTSGPAGPALLAEGFVNGKLHSGSRPAEFFAGATLSWQLRDRRDLSVGAPGVFFANLGLGEPSTVMAAPILPPQFTQTTWFSVPTGFAVDFPTILVGGSTGPVPMQSFQVPPGLLPIGTVIRMQPLVLDGTAGNGFQWHTSEPIRFELQPPAIVVSAEGRNSLNSDATEGFWKVRHLDRFRPQITRVVLDGTLNSMNFVTDEPGMAGVFENGNSSAVGCGGTYRNGSDVATGLVYDPLNTSPATPCDPTANTGWIGTNEVKPGTYRTLEFRFNSFSSGSTFEFDAYALGLAGSNGGAMAWMTITVELADGTVFTGPLAADPDDRDRSEVRF